MCNYLYLVRFSFVLRPHICGGFGGSASGRMKLVLFYDPSDCLNYNDDHADDLKMCIVPNCRFPRFIGARYRKVLCSLRIALPCGGNAPVIGSTAASRRTRASQMLTGK